MPAHTGWSLKHLTSQRALLAERTLLTGRTGVTGCERNIPFLGGTRLKPVTILGMILAVFAIKLLEVMFFIGLAGAAIVVLISFFEDFKELFGEE